MNVLNDVCYQVQTVACSDEASRECVIFSASQARAVWTVKHVGKMMEDSSDSEAQNRTSLALMVKIVLIDDGGNCSILRGSFRIVQKCECPFQLYILSLKFS